jgi:hypothetical protein
MKSELCCECTNAEEKSGLDINFLLERISSYKNENNGQLSSKDILYICLCICLYPKSLIAYRIYQHKMPKTPEDLANWKERNQKVKNLNSEMSDRAHFWIKSMMGIEGNYQRINWPEFINFCKKNGLKKEQSNFVNRIQKRKSLNQQKKILILSGDPESLERLNQYITEETPCKILQEFKLENE